LHVPWNGGGAVWDRLLGSGACPGTRLVARRSRAGRKGARPDWLDRINLAHQMADGELRPLPDQRFDLVDSLLALLARCLAFLSPRLHGSQKPEGGAIAVLDLLLGRATRVWVSRNHLVT